MSDLSFLEGRFLPHRVVPGWLGEARAEALLAYILAEQGRFRPAKVMDGLDPTSRHALVLKGLGPFEAILSACAHAPATVAQPHSQTLTEKRLSAKPPPGQETGSTSCCAKDGKASTLSCTGSMSSVRRPLMS